MTEQAKTQNDRFLVLNPSYGYLNEDVEYRSFDIEEAALFTADDIKHNDLDTDDYIKTRLTQEQINDMPFSLPACKSDDVKLDISDLSNDQQSL